METKLKYGLIVIIGSIILLLVDLPITVKKLAGVYTNNNYNTEPFYAEIPYIKDTLILNNNGTYSSNYYPNGTYEIKSGLFQNQLTITYEIKSEIPKSILVYSDSKQKTKSLSGKGSYIFEVKNRLFQSIKIQLVEEQNYYYSKKY